MQVSERPTREGGLVIMYTDITDLKQSEKARREKALEQKTRLLQRTVDSLSQGVAVVNDEGALEVWNGRFLELAGLAPIEAHRPFDEVMEDSELELFTPYSRSEQGAPVLTCEQHLGNGRVLEVRTHPMPTGGFVNTFTDITERDLYARALEDSERWVRLITDHVPALIAYVGADLTYQFTNKVYEDWYGWARGEILGQSLHRVHSAEQYSRLEPYIARAFNGESVSFEFAEANLDGHQRYLLRSYVPNRDSDGEVVGIFVMIRDITERRRTSEALHQAYQHLEQRVRERTQEKIARVSLPPEAQEALDEQDDAIIEFAANENAAVVKGHRTTLERWRGITNRYAEILEGQVERGTMTVEVPDGTAEIDVPLDYVGKCLGFGTQALERVVKLERQNYGLDLKEGDDKAPEAELTDEELEVRIAKLTQQVGGEQ